jgi:hypothetical protein
MENTWINVSKPENAGMCEVRSLNVDWAQAERFQVGLKTIAREHIAANCWWEHESSRDLHSQ